jgi:hypothetical protein
MENGLTFAKTQTGAKRDWPDLLSGGRPSRTLVFVSSTPPILFMLYSHRHGKHSTIEKHCIDTQAYTRPAPTARADALAGKKRPAGALFHSLVRTARYFVFHPVHAGGSLAGNDSSPASSTKSRSK